MATTGEGRVKEDAGIIVREALRMRQTVETLLEFWRPAAQSEEPVDVTGLMRELAAACAEKLESRGVRLVVQAGQGGYDGAGKQGSAAADDGASVEQCGAGAGWHGRCDGRGGAGDSGVGERFGERGVGERVHLVVSDTGPGFAQPGRVFEPVRFDGAGAECLLWDCA